MRPSPISDRPSGFRGTFRTDPLARSVYAEGAGIARELPAAVAVPADADDLPALVQWARFYGHTLIPRGSGTGMAGGAVGPGVIVDLSRFTTMEPVEVDARSVRVGVGALRGTVDAAARSQGLRFPVDPSSGAFCTIGGMVASNAAGARSLRYGATRPWVRAIHAVFDDGTSAWVRRGEPWPLHIPAVARLATALQQTAAMDAAQLPPGLLAREGVLKESSGYAVAATLAPGGHLVDLLVGSEGTLALFTAVELALCPVPGATGTVLAVFPSLETATTCAMAARDLGVSACELLDRTFLDVAATDGPTGIDPRAEAVLLIEVEGDDAAAVTAQIAQLSDRCLAEGAESVATGLDAETQHRLWALRHAASPILARLAPRLRSMQFIEDGCVPPVHFPAYVRGVRAALARAGITGVIFGHAGDAHAHVNPLVDVTQPDWRDRVTQLWSDVAALTAQLGGTLAGEHGDGRLRAPWLPRSWPVAARAVFANIKAAADPTGVFNAGCKVAAETAPLLPAAMRHDPEAEPLDPRARAFLAQIEQTRRWQTFRLDGAPAP